MQRHFSHPKTTDNSSLTTQDHRSVSLEDKGAFFKIVTIFESISSNTCVVASGKAGFTTSQKSKKLFVLSTRFTMSENPVTSLLAAHSNSSTAQYGRLGDSSNFQLDGKPRSTAILAIGVCIALICVILVVVAFGISIPILLRSPATSVSRTLFYLQRGANKFVDRDC